LGGGFVGKTGSPLVKKKEMHPRYKTGKGFVSEGREILMYKVAKKGMPVVKKNSSRQHYLGPGNSTWRPIEEGKEVITSKRTPTSVSPQ